MPTTESNKDLVICWVNTTEQPVKVVRHSVFKTNGATKDKDLEVSELCSLFYLRDGVVLDALLSWEKVNITPGTKTLFRNIDKTSEALSKLTELSHNYGEAEIK